MDLELDPIALELAERFESNGFELALVGGSVRDLLLKKQSKDLDFTTNATPDETHSILNQFCDNVWDIGKEFGTIGGLKNEVQIEVTTYRTDQYNSKTRKPLVEYGKSLEQDLSRRDFTVNAIAIRLPTPELVDPFNGLGDLMAKRLKTPIDPELSFSDDPLRMLRAVRFVSTLGFDIERGTADAIVKMLNSLEKVSAERIRDEFSKLLLGNNPILGINCLVDSGLIDYILPELNALKMSIDPEHNHKDVFVHSLKVLENAIEFEKAELNGEPNLTVRLSALLHDIGKPQTRKFHSNGKVSFLMHDVVGAKITKRALQRLHFPNDLVKDVSKLVELHMRFYGYGEQGWTDSAVRRYVHDAGDVLEYLHILSRSDVTTKNSQKAKYLADGYKAMMNRIEEIRATEEINKIRPDLDGFEIMEILKVKGQRDGWKTGKAYKFLLNWRIEEGPHSKEEATDKLLEFAKTENLI